MSKKISQFRFKQFSVSHHRSSMKVGVDGVMIGCWVDISKSHSILDVGTGCGLIALILAQRAPESTIDAIDIDIPSIEEARENISVSPWRDRIRAHLCSFANAGSLLTDIKRGYDLIVSNPPYFDSGVTETITPREKARHQGELSPLALLKGAKEILNPEGSVAMVIPSEYSEALEKRSFDLGYQLIGKCLYRGHEGAPYKRSLLQWKFENSIAKNMEIETQYLTLETATGLPTDEYRKLCRDFYLRF